MCGTAARVYTGVDWLPTNIINPHEYCTCRYSPRQELPETLRRENGDIFGIFRLSSAWRLHPPYGIFGYFLECDEYYAVRGVFQV